MSGWRLKALLVSTSCLCGASFDVQAADVTWNGPAGVGGNGNWNVPGNWSSGTVPNDPILGTATTRVLIDGGKPASSIVTLNQDATIGTLVIGSGDGLSINDSRRLTMDPFVLDSLNPTWTNAGTMNLNSAGSATGIRLGLGAFTTKLTGGGTINLSNNVNNIIDGTGTSPFDSPSLDNVDNTIQGSGRLGSAATNRLRFSNHGTVNANSSAGLTISFSGFADNGGVYKATNGGTLIFDGTGGSGMQIDNTPFDGGNGVIQNQSSTFIVKNATTDDGLVDLMGTAQTKLQGGAGINTLVGGTINNALGATITSETGSNALGGTINNAGKIAAVDGTTLELRNLPTVNNTNRIDINGDTATTTLQIGQTVTLTGGGLVHFTDSANNKVDKNTVNTWNQVVNENNTIDGSFVWTNVVLTNRGTVDSNASNGMDLSSRSPSDPNGGPTGMTNSGLMQANGGKLTLRGPGIFSNLLNNFEGSTQGTIRAKSSEVDLITTLVQGGIVETTGTGTLTLHNSQVSGGTINNSSQGTIRSALGTSEIGGTILNDTGGQVLVDTGTQLYISAGSTVTNKGTIAVTNGGLGIDGFAGSATLKGGGLVKLSANATTLVRGAFGNERLINVDNTIEGSGQFGQNNMYLTNSGLIDANGSVGMLMRLRNNATQMNFNTGTIRASNGSTLEIGNATLMNTGGTVAALTGSQVHILSDGGIKGGMLTSSGTGSIFNEGTVIADAANAMTITPASGAGFLNGGTVRVDAGGALTVLGGYTQVAGLTQVNGTLSNQAIIVIDGGVLSGAGHITGSILNSGAVNPGNSPGILIIDGDYLTDSDGIFNVEIGGTTLGLFDRLQIGGEAILDGILNITLVDGFQAHIGDEFEIMTFAHGDGIFDLVNGLAFAPGLAFDLIYGDTDVMLRVRANDISSAPTPATVALLLGGLATLAALRRRRAA